MHDQNPITLHTKNVLIFQTTHVNLTYRNVIYLYFLMYTYFEGLAIRQNGI